MKDSFIDSTIFVQIAAYRDKELRPTIENLLRTCRYPNNLHICICHQHHPKDKWDHLDEYKEDPRFTIIDIDSRKAKGACWARWRIQQEYTGEDYTFQLDSHHRFIDNWDVELKKMYQQCKLNGSEKPLITAYIPAYDTETSKPIDNEPWQLSFNYFGPEGPLHTIPETLKGWKSMGGPAKARFFSAHFAFADGAFSTDVQHDPEMYFHGEEISLAVRAFTHGYDLFHPHKVIAWHHYGRQGNPKHWDDKKDWNKSNQKSYSRVRKLFGIGGEKFAKGECKRKYNFGKVRTLADYEKYAGVQFKGKRLQQYTLDNNLAPNPIIEDEKAYKASFKGFFKLCIDLQFDQVPSDDYEFWAVAFFNDKDEEVHREDANVEEIKRLKDDKDGYVKLWRSFATNENIVKWRVWPCSKSNGFEDAIESTIG
tara:strand:- start:65 stop:1336 length:1272 start_codon:yes stop_codon:yes gene_type:complete